MIEASGVEPIGDGRRLLVAHDKDPALYIVDVESGRILGEPITSPRFPKKNEVGPKWEGMARDAEGNFYLIGAHNGKTDEERATKNVLIRFRLKDGDSPAIDDASIVTWHVARSLEAALKSEGLPPEEVAKRKVEGLTIREQKTADGLGPSRALHRPARARRTRSTSSSADITHSTVARRRARAQARVCLPGRAARRRRPRSSPRSNTCPRWAASWSSRRRKTRRTPSTATPSGSSPTAKPAGPSKVATFEVAMKAEGLAILGVEKAGPRTAVKLLITYDNDPHATHIPSRFQTATLVRDGR